MVLVASIVLKLLAAALLARVAVMDFTKQKITNSDVLLLLCLGLGSLQLTSVAFGSWWNMGLSAIAALVLFLALFPFWAMRKLGAGDVKLMAVMPFVIGGSSLAVFSLLLLVFALVTALAVKNPFMLPAGAFRVYVQHLDRKGVVPFGVPISAAAICTIAAQIAYGLNAFG
ncbi:MULTISPECIES: prepilin peptidase [unclassified Mesorhizobium]|uniref:prepilin peptidase n=1 Tax=unclassified Mesorhizobium TaxID=325217 RepID=UPI000FCA4CB4|nr:MULTISPECIES: prepilin peptidase [unclassified Mesorhizobium]RUW34581.1 prepilin peptidase [Mesorhizobium sp. M1E.F.Ca.ET.041.01.1.1]RWD88902.1 MAG: prepilin peptidase [Mesorhizobium sp.]RWD90696.1 MAG: prepilin peptidase [Mesorhizobium sp.]TIV52499.1 MAG: prepilin peptidase [Mesorhizobium sp.]